MDKLPHDVLLRLLSLLDDSADVARCRVASKAFNAVFPGLRSIHLRCFKEWEDRAASSQLIKPFKTVFLDLISKLKTVESVCLVLDWRIFPESDEFYFHDEADFVKEWLPRVSGSLKSLSIISNYHFQSRSNVLVPIFEYCPNLVSLKLRGKWLSVDKLNPMPMLTSLTLETLGLLEDENLNQLNKCFPNLEFLKLYDVNGLEDPKIHLLNLKTCFWRASFDHPPPSLTIITPNLITLTIECFDPPVTLHIEAPMLSHFHFDAFSHADAFMVKKFENLKTLWLAAFHIGFLLSKFPITKTVETLTLHKNKGWHTNRDSEFTLGKVFTLFPNVSSLSINSGAWMELEACLNPKSCKTVYGRKKPRITICQCSRCLNSDASLESKSQLNGLKIICAYLKLVDPSLTFSTVACVLDQCVSVSKVSLLIHSDVTGPVRESFRSKCMAHWPGLKWRWGIWREYREDSWITDGSSV